MDNTNDPSIDQLLFDFHPETKKQRNWERYKKESLCIAQSYKRLSEIYPDIYKHKCTQMENCGTFLQFKEFTGTFEKVLNNANFCKLPMCRMCGWRRSLKIFGQTSQIMDVAEQDGFRFLFLTLTIRNVFGDDLGGKGGALDHLFNSFIRLVDRKAYKSAVYGWMRNLEITHNVDPNDIWYDTYHPHLHAILAVKESYFIGRNYISHDQLMKDWRKCAKLNYDPRVYIQAVKKGDKGSIREVSKYATKPGDIINDNPDLMDSAVMYIDHAITSRRLVSYGGILKQIKADLNLDDVENGDLVNTDQESSLREDLEYILVNYRWNSGYGQYIKSGEERLKK